jgi:hypothetical protein
MNLGPAMRDEGFTGSGLNWRMRNSHGDWACINIQKSAYGSANDVSAYMNLSINPLSMHLFEAESHGRIPAKQPSGAGGLWGARLKPPQRDDQRGRQDWNFGDGSSGRVVVSAMVDALRADGVPRLRGFLRRERMLALLADDAPASVGGGDLAAWDRTAIRALLLSDDGPSAELDALLERVEREAESLAGDHFSKEHNASLSARRKAVVKWVRARTASK